MESAINKLCAKKLFNFGVSVIEAKVGVHATAAGRIFKVSIQPHKHKPHNSKK